LPRIHDRAILRLSRGGGDAVVLREFDVATKAFVPGGFHLPEAKGGAEWLDKDTLLLSSALGDGMATASGYARTVRLWRRGVDVARASMLFETTPDSMSAWASVAPDSLLGIALSGFLAGDRNFTVLFAPGERRALQSFFWADGQLVLSILDELQPIFEVLRPSADGWARSKLSMAE
jgi:prolyl oligopeptidase PreP (S9A serine peptidase family)